jgi:hypothetical protein
MKKYTLQDFYNFEVIDGIKQCPPGDYTDLIGDLFINCSFNGQSEFAKSVQFVNCQFRGCQVLNTNDNSNRSFIKWLFLKYTKG